MDLEYLKAVLCIAKYFPVFPVRERTLDDLRKRKRPYIKGWGKEATQDRKQIQRWWKEFPKALVGVPTGKRSGIFAIDLDEYEGLKGHELLQFLPDMPKTLWNITQRGVHLLFKFNEKFPVANSTGVLHAGIDVRGEGGYIIVPPSEGYRWKGSFKDLAEGPTEIYDRLSTINREVIQSSKEIKPASVVIDALNRLDPADYSGYHEWTRLMLICHHASGADEEVLEAFKAWSQKDELAWNDNTDQLLEYQWRMAHTERENQVSFGSLVYEVKKKHGHYIKATEFDDVEEIRESRQLQASKNGAIKRNLYNMLIILEEPEVAGVPNPLANMFRWNELSWKAEFIKDPPWATGKIGKVFDNQDTTRLLAHISGTLGVDFTVDSALQAVDASARHNFSYHPVRQYLEGLSWDGKPRLGTWLIDYCNTKNNEYNRLVGRKFIIGAVARALCPGSKMDTMLVLEGAQGTRKTTLVQVLAGPWYRSPSLKSLSGAEAVLACLGAWFCEIEEMAAAKGTSIDFLKKFISSNKDTIRFVYDKVPSDLPRSCVLVGTMNPLGDNTYIHDSTGGRRFWPVEVLGKIDTLRIEEVRDQLFAEAVAMYNAGEPWHMQESEEGLAKEVQRARIGTHPWTEMVYDYYYTGEGKDHKAISAMDVWMDALGRYTNLIDTQSRASIGRIMRHDLGWDLKSTRLNKFGENTGRVSSKYIRPDDLEDL